MEQFKKDLLEAFNANKELPLDAKYYVLKDLTRDIEAIYYNALREQEAKKNAGEQTVPETNISE